MSIYHLELQTACLSGPLPLPGRAVLEVVIQTPRLLSTLRRKHATKPFQLTEAAGLHLEWTQTKGAKVFLRLRVLGDGADGAFPARAGRAAPLPGSGPAATAADAAAAAERCLCKSSFAAVDLAPEEPQAVQLALSVPSGWGLAEPGQAHAQPHGGGAGAGGGGAEGGSKAGSPDGGSTAVELRFVVRPGPPASADRAASGAPSPTGAASTPTSPAPAAPQAWGEAPAAAAAAGGFSGDASSNAAPPTPGPAKKRSWLLAWGLGGRSVSGTAAADGAAGSPSSGAAAAHHDGDGGVNGATAAANGALGSLHRRSSEVVAAATGGPGVGRSRLVNSSLAPLVPAGPGPKPELLEPMPPSAFAGGMEEQPWNSDAQGGSWRLGWRASRGRPNLPNALSSGGGGVLTAAAAAAAPPSVVPAAPPPPPPAPASNLSLPAAPSLDSSSMDTAGPPAQTLTGLTSSAAAPPPPPKRRRLGDFLSRLFSSSASSTEGRRAGGGGGASAPPSRRPPSLNGLAPLVPPSPRLGDVYRVQDNALASDGGVMLGFGMTPSPAGGSPNSVGPQPMCVLPGLDSPGCGENSPAAGPNRLTIEPPVSPLAAASLRSPPAAVAGSTAAAAAAAAQPSPMAMSPAVPPAGCFFWRSSYGAKARAAAAAAAALADGMAVSPRPSPAAAARDKPAAAAAAAVTAAAAAASTSTPPSAPPSGRLTALGSTSSSHAAAAPPSGSGVATTRTLVSCSSGLSAHTGIGRHSTERRLSRNTSIQSAGDDAAGALAAAAALAAAPSPPPPPPHPLEAEVNRVANWVGSQRDMGDEVNATAMSQCQFLVDCLKSADTAWLVGDSLLQLKRELGFPFDTGVPIAGAPDWFRLVLQPPPPPPTIAAAAEGGATENGELPQAGAVGSALASGAADAHCNGSGNGSAGGGGGGGGGSSRALGSAAGSSSGGAVAATVVVAAPPQRGPDVLKIRWARFDQRQAGGANACAAIVLEVATWCLAAIDRHRAAAAAAAAAAAGGGGIGSFSRTSPAGRRRGSGGGYHDGAVAPAPEDERHSGGGSGSGAPPSGRRELTAALSRSQRERLAAAALELESLPRSAFEAAIRDGVAVWSSLLATSPAVRVASSTGDFDLEHMLQLGGYGGKLRLAEYTAASLLADGSCAGDGGARRVSRELSRGSGGGAAPDGLASGPSSASLLFPSLSPPQQQPHAHNPHPPPAVSSPEAATGSAGAEPRPVSPPQANGAVAPRPPRPPKPPPLQLHGSPPGTAPGAAGAACGVEANGAPHAPHAPPLSARRSHRPSQSGVPYFAALVRGLPQGVYVLGCHGHFSTLWLRPGGTTHVIDSLGARLSPDCPLGWVAEFDHPSDFAAFFMARHAARGADVAAMAELDIAGANTAALVEVHRIELAGPAAAAAAAAGAGSGGTASRPPSR